MLPNIRIAIVDDHPIVIQGLKMMLEKQRDFRVCGTFSSGEGILQFINYEKPDVVLLDISLPDGNGADLCSYIKKKSPETCVLMFSNRSERSTIMECLKNGASGYLLKNAALEELRECIFGAFAGQIVFCRQVKDIIKRPSEHGSETLPRLTKREKEILNMVMNGKTSTEIAAELHLSPLTVDTHRKNLLQKFGAKNTADLIQMAVRSGTLE